MKVRAKILIPTLILCTLAVVIPSVIGVYTMIQALENEDILAMKKDANNLMTNLSIAISRRVAEFEVITYPTAYLNSQATTDEKIDFLKNVVKSSKSYITMSIFDVNGIEIGDTMNIGIGNDASNEEFFKQAITGKIYRGDKPEFSAPIQKHVIYFSGPIYKDGKIDGVVVGRYPLDRIYRLISPLQEERLFQINLLSSDGTLIYSSANKKDILSKNLGSEPIFENVIDSNNNVAHQISDEKSYLPNSLIVGVKSPISQDSGSDYWVLLISRHVDDAFSVPQTLQNQLIIFGAILTVIVIISVLFVVQKFTDPIRDLRNAASNIANGNLGARYNIKSNDEFGDLGRSFNAMISAIQKTNIEKEEFAAMVSHELKTPLIPISGYAELFLDGSLGQITPEQKEKLHIIYENSIRLTNLIQDILDARKIELGKLKLDLRDESVKEVVKRSIDIFGPIAQQRGITLSDNTEDVIVRCDTDRILQVLNNIISNAIKFVPTQYGTISINSRIENGLVMLSIKDNGIGIPKEKQDDLFKKFYQVDKTLTRKSGGTGLGLAISRGIVESHGGKIWVESEENHGTVVHFTLPRGGKN
ncbi:MAG: sensor histidine kinase [Thaumarchaeota archaeon]|nr:sensor histidine kinase [Nitrososphaerota archaeon]